MSLFGKNDRDEARSETPAGPGAVESPTATVSPARTSADTTAARPSAGREGGGVANIGKSVVFKGDLSGDEDLEIEGRIEGQIQLPNHQLTIGAHGQVKAQIEAKTVVVVGHVSGNVNASERVEVQATGVVDGDIRAPRLLVQEGAVVNGAIDMGAKPEAATPPAPAPAKSA